MNEDRVGNMSASRVTNLKKGLTHEKGGGIIGKFGNITELIEEEEEKASHLGDGDTEDHTTDDHDIKSKRIRLLQNGSQKQKINYL